MNAPWMEFVPLLWEGLKVTAEVAFLAAIAALALSGASGLCRVSKYRTVQWAAKTYTELFRGIPLLVLLIWVYFALPFAGLELPKLAAAVLAIGLNYGAFGSEIVRSSIEAVPAGQREAGIALNFTPAQRMLYLILPQALPRMLPPFGNLLIELVKATSLIYFITLSDLTYQAMILRNNFLPWTPHIFGLLLILYFLLSVVITVVVKWLERRLTEGRV
ncbi:ectoine/hydroxyectoine ABC transporter permease subunit EhuC [Cohnella rhizosphaerae]|uniref:Ectoine/hydroxyectoine ABC transporter permease subunit EhuC n=2 Tax=Cohnella rhizosphaerae TaxID=1457232 RepID=A0A9X4QRK0_9BACL|nr:ectoine/hydroxyectoine ABC transporter permease subunit EhuC [Cohnella rhizosphaerae]MDG0809126.1 ectoine/hydroxyectoine ABC transporter permease subunit EhuC [Cohnella rhizosphaerae]